MISCTNIYFSIEGTDEINTFSAEYSLNQNKDTQTQPVSSEHSIKHHFVDGTTNENHMWLSRQFEYSGKQYYISSPEFDRIGAGSCNYIHSHYETDDKKPCEYKYLQHHFLVLQRSCCCSYIYIYSIRNFKVYYAI